MLEVQRRVNIRESLHFAGVQIHPGSIWNLKWLGPDSKRRRQGPRWCRKKHWETLRGDCAKGIGAWSVEGFKVIPTERRKPFSVHV